MTTTNDGGENNLDERVTQLLRELEQDFEMDDLQFEYLARRITASAAQEMQRRTQVTRGRSAVWWRGGLISAGLAAIVAFVLMFVHADGVSHTDTERRSIVASAEQEAALDERGNLFAASIGAVSEHDFIVNLWDDVDTEALLTRGERQ